MTKHDKALGLYSAIYNPIFIHPAPASLTSDGFEMIEVACWERKPIEDLIESLKTNATTTHFEILRFVNKKIDDIYLSRLMPDLAPRQDYAIKLAFEHGYYNFPRKTNLDKLAELANISKPAFRENLRRAEAKLMPKLISD